MKKMQTRSEIIAELKKKQEAKPQRSILTLLLYWVIGFAVAWVIVSNAYAIVTTLLGILAIVIAVFVFLLYIR